LKKPGRAAILIFGALGLAVAQAGTPPPIETIVWRGDVQLAADLVIPRGSRLVVEPGTTVRFGFRDDDGDGWGDASLRIEGELVSRGRPESPVVFTSQQEPAEPGNWGEIRIDFGSLDLSYTVIEGSTRGLHAHFSSGRVEDCVLRRNVDGTRFGESSVAVEHCLFYGHPGKAFNARKCRNQVRANVFHDNENGVFLFEADGGSAFEGNLFRANRNPFRLGDFFEGVVPARGNDWGGELPAAAQPDRDSGAARLEATSGAAPGAGPRAWPFWAEGPRPGEVRDTSPPAAAPGGAGGLLFQADDSGAVRAVEASTRRVVWRRPLGAGVRSEPWPAGSTAVAVATVGGRVYLLDRMSGLERDCWEVEGETQTRASSTPERSR